MWLLIAKSIVLLFALFFTVHYITCVSAKLVAFNAAIIKNAHYSFKIESMDMFTTVVLWALFYFLNQI